VLSRAPELLSSWTTLRLGGPARAFIQADSRPDLYKAVAQLDAQHESALVIGGGSNLVVADAGFDGTVVRAATRGIAVRELDDTVEVHAEAGESWEEFVGLAVSEGWGGVEALAGIPGTVGAVPIQNVGAYGQEVAQTITAVSVFDRSAAVERTISAAECGFGYRNSRFKSDPGHFIVGAVTFRFQRSRRSAPVRYGELARQLGVQIGEQAPTDQLREAVLQLRTAKGMVLDAGDHDTWSAGSFFTNPFVAPAALPRGAPSFEQRDDKVKTSAAWLIEQAGFPRGYGNDKVRVSSKHTLALTNRGTATTADLLALASTIRTRVRSRFGIELQPEPVLVGCELS
jgi:UDP-N-acetylmuramate dehydrogenase